MIQISIGVVLAVFGFMITINGLLGEINKKIEYPTDKRIVATDHNYNDKNGKVVDTITYLTLQDKKEENEKTTYNIYSPYTITKEKKQ